MCAMFTPFSIYGVDVVPQVKNFFLFGYLL